MFLFNYIKKKFNNLYNLYTYILNNFNKSGNIN